MKNFVFAIAFCLIGLISAAVYAGEGECRGSNCKLRTVVSVPMRVVAVPVRVVAVPVVEVVAAPAAEVVAVKECCAPSVAAVATAPVRLVRQAVCHVAAKRQAAKACRQALRAASNCDCQPCDCN
jgi:hypothetical protein